MAKKSHSKEEKEHLSKVAQMGCIACEKIGFYDTPSEVHHVRNGHGMGQRPSHFDTIPLCCLHHRLGPDAVHSSKKVFEQKFGTQTELLAIVKERLKYLK